MFEYLDIIPEKVFCFGYDKNPNRDWVDIAKASIEKGWKHVDVGAIESSLTENVEQSYSYLASFWVSDPATDTKWVVRFNNDDAMWILDLDREQGTDAEVLPEQKEEFFKSETMKKIAKQTADYLIQANKILEEVVMNHIENGELMKVNPIKLERIVFLISNPRGFQIQNLQSCKFKY